jgi:hypothetical protein
VSPAFWSEGTTLNKKMTNAGLKEFLACAIDNRIVIQLDD